MFAPGLADHVGSSGVESMITRSAILALLCCVLLSAVAGCDAGDDSTIAFAPPPFRPGQWRISGSDLEINATMPCGVSVAFGGKGNRVTTIENSAGTVVATIRCGDVITSVSLPAAGIYTVRPRYGAGDCSSTGTADIPYTTVDFTSSRVAMFTGPTSDNTTQVTVEMDGIETWDSSSGHH
jgi:hypothetical protein